MAKAKRAGGRPTSYNTAVNTRALAYIRGDYERVGDLVPSRAGLAVGLECTRETLIEWGRVNPEFSDTLKRLDAMQEKLLVSGGLSGTMNPTISKLMLANHGYSDRVQQDNVSSDGSMSPRNTIADLVKALDEARHRD